MSATEGAPRDDDGGDPVAALEDLPAALCEPLARAVRRAADVLPRSTLPGQLRPLAGWRPQGLTDPRARRAMAAALGDARFREQVRTELAVEADEDEDVSRLARRLGEPDAVAALAAAGRWRDLAVLAAQATQGRLAASGTAAEPSPAREPPVSPPETTSPEARELRQELKSAQRRALDAERRGAGELARADRAEARAAGLTASLADVRAERDSLAEELAQLRRRHRDRVSRLRQRATAAESRAAPGEQERRELAEQLELLAARLRGGPSAPASTDGAAPAPPSDGPERPAGAEIPRGLPAARAGRPAVLPPGASTADPAGVGALLRTPGIVAIIDGYNVTKDSAGRPGATLEEQRRWLLMRAAEATARFGCRPIAVFDGAEPRPAASPTARNVRVAFSPPDEEADDHIVALVAGMDPGTPAVVVTSDRELRDRVDPYQVDLLTARAFLTALQG